MLDFDKTVSDGIEGNWERAKTTRRYLHPSKAERMFTLWREGKIIMGEVVRGKDYRDYSDLDCSGIWLVGTKYVRSFDPRTAKLGMQEDGTPIHSIIHQSAGFEITLEAFCDCVRKPTCFIKINVKNTAPYTATQQIGLLVRSGKEKQLVYGSPDEYCTYMPDVAEFKYTKKTFEYKDGILSDGDVFIKPLCDSSVEFDEEQGVLWMFTTLKSGESIDYTFAFGKGEVKAYDYDVERENTQKYWKTQLARITHSFKNPDIDRMVKNLTVQILQCLCHYVNGDFLVLRQGGLQRLIWPWEAMPALEALGYIGDFDDEIKAVLSAYFDVLWKDDGEIENIGENWASVTSSCLYSLSTYCIQKNDADLWKKYHDKAMKTYEWICEKRRESKGIEGAIEGLFPPMRGSDWPELFQHWTNTDCSAYSAMSTFGEAAKKFADVRADEIEKEAADYKKLMADRLIAYLDNGGKRVPLLLEGDDRDILATFYPYLNSGAPLSFMTEELGRERIEGIFEYYKKVGICKNGLTGRFPYKDGNTHVWYTSIPDYFWFLVWEKLGDCTRMKEIIDAQIKYSMTDEYYMLERYSDVDPYYSPWSPNVSASGRIILMLLKYGRDEKK